MPEPRIPVCQRRSSDNHHGMSASLETSYLLDVVGENSGDSLLDNENELSSSSLMLLGSKLSSQEKLRQAAADSDNQSKKQTSAGHLLSPFSPKLVVQPHARQQQQEEEESVSWAPPDFFRDGDLSLQPCRKVSVVVHISYQSSHSSPCTDDTHTTATDTAANSLFSSSASSPSSSKTPQLCLFPLIPHNHINQNGNNNGNTTGTPELSPTSATLNASAGSRDLIVVNPSAFGKFIPSEITMQTARLVAQVANIESEDWARTYRFSNVIWPQEKVQSFLHLAQAMANDVTTNTHTNTTNNSRIVIATGSSHDKTNIIFGKTKNNNTTCSTAPTPSKKKSTTDTPKQSKDNRELLEEYGLVGLTFDKLLQKLPHYAVCALSVYEIVQEDIIHDLLSISTTPMATNNNGHNHNSNSNSKRSSTPHTVQIRQPRDGKGAVIEGLTEFPVDSLESLRECLEPILAIATHNNNNNKKLGRFNNIQKTAPSTIPYAHTYQGGHVIVSLKIWQNAVQHDLNRQTRCATLTFVDLVSGVGGTSGTTGQHSGPSSLSSASLPIEFSNSDLSPTPHYELLSSPGRSSNASLSKTSSSSVAEHTRRRQQQQQGHSTTTTTSRQSAFLRTSVSSLGGVLKGALMKESGSDTVIPYRNSTLTKVLQRSLDHPDSRVVVLASLSPLSDAYDGTLSTLRYVERLLVRTGLPKSPFEKRPLKQPSSKHSSPQTVTSQLSTSSTTMASPPSQPQILMEQFASKESILESVITDPRQRLARFYRSQQQKEDSPTNSTVEASEEWRTGYMKVDPGTIHRDEEPVDGNANAATNRDTEGGDERDKSHPETGRPLSTSFLAEYIIPPVSPVRNDGGGNRSDSSFGSIQKQELPFLEETAGSFDPDPSYLPYRPTTNGRLRSDITKKAEDPPPQESFTLNHNQNTTAQPLDVAQESPKIDPKTLSFSRRTPFQFSNSPMDETLSHQDSSLPAEPVGIYQDPLDGQPSSTGFFREIATLESSVDTMKNANHGIWQASASSIRQLKDFQLAQQSTLNDLIAQRDHAMDMARKSQEEYSKLSQKMGDLLKDKDSEIITLKDIVDKAQSDRSDVEKIAEEAIASQDILEHAVSELENKLIANRTSSQNTQSELQKMTQEKEQVSEELYQVKSELFASKSSLNEKDITVKEIEFNLKSLENERQQLMRLQAESEEALKHLKDELVAANETHQIERDDWKSKVSDLKRENKLLSSRQSSREKEFSNQLEKVEDALKRCKGELATARRDLEKSMQQDQIVSKNMQAERTAFRHEIAQLKSALKARSGERDEAMKQLDQNRTKYEDAMAEHDRTRDDLGQRVADVEELSATLQQALEEQEVLRDELFRKDRNLENYQVETRHRVQQAAQYRDDAVALLDTTAAENRTLLTTNQKLQEALEKLKVERDEVVRSRDAGLHALSDVQNSVNNLKRKSEDTESAHYRLKRERDTLKSERDKLRQLLRDVHRDHSEVLNTRTKEQEALSALRLENDSLLRKQSRGLGSLQRERDSLKAERDRLEERLRETQRDRDDVLSENKRASDALASTRSEIEHLKRQKEANNGAITDDNNPYRSMERYSTPLHTRFDREFMESVDIPPPETPFTSTSDQTRHRPIDENTIGSFAVPPSGLGDRRNERTKESKGRPRADDFLGSLPIDRTHDAIANPPLGVSSRRGHDISSSPIPSNARRLAPRDSGRLASALANAGTGSGRYPAYYLSDEDDKELLITALKQKVKLLEKAFILGEEKPPWQK